MLANIATVIAPLFICAGIGFLWGRHDRPFDSSMVTTLSMNLGMPCLIFSTLTRLEVKADAFAEMAGVFGIAMVCFFAFSAAALLLLRLELRTFLPALSSPNTGNMGLPLTFFAFGNEGLTLSIGIFVVASIIGMTVGMGIYSGRTSYDLVTRNPLVYGIGAALVFMIAGLQPPRWLANTVEIVAGMAIPLMLIALGVAISRLRVNSVRRSMGLSALKLASGFAIGYAIAELFGLEGVARGVLILQSSMPVAVHNYLFAQRFDRQPSEIAGMVLMSTAMSYATLPLVLWVVL